MRRFLQAVTLVLLAGLFAGGYSAQAQAVEAVPLTLGQPVLVTLAAGETRTFTYSPAQTATVTFQALGQAAAPSLALARDGQVLAEEANTAQSLTITLTALLTPGGGYELTLGNPGGESGTLVLTALSETPVPALTLSPDIPLSGQVDAATPATIVRFTTLDEPAYLYIDSSGLVESGANFRIINGATGRVAGLLGSESTGGRFRFPAGITNYEITASFSQLTISDSFTMCLTAISAGGCGAGQSGADVVATVAALATETPVPACMVTPQGAGGANIRQSASTSSPLTGALPGGQSATVLGIAPNGAFYNIQYNNLTGWVALSVVNASGKCAGLPVVQPPPFVVPPTATPVPPTTAPTATTLPTATSAGPCLITVTSAFLVYTQPTAIPDYIYDQVSPGYQLVPVGRLADNSWWKTNYLSSWVETSQFGSNAQVSGDCYLLPIIMP